MTCKIIFYGLECAICDNKSWVLEEVDYLSSFQKLTNLKFYGFEAIIFYNVL